MNIILAWVAEHRAFCATFAGIEGLLPGVRQLAEVHRLACKVEALLDLHGQAEEDLVLLALDQVPRHQAWSRSFHQQHKEIDCSLTQAQVCQELADAKRLLQQALQHSRRHFAYEECKVFPFFEKWIDRELLEKLGRIWEHRQRALLA